MSPFDFKAGILEDEERRRMKQHFFLSKRNHWSINLIHIFILKWCMGWDFFTPDGSMPVKSNNEKLQNGFSFARLCVWIEFCFSMKDKLLGNGVITLPIWVNDSLLLSGEYMTSFTIPTNVLWIWKAWRCHFSKVYLCELPASASHSFIPSLCHSILRQRLRLR